MSAVALVVAIVLALARAGVEDNPHLKPPPVSAGHTLTEAPADELLQEDDFPEFNWDAGAPAAPQEVDVVLGPHAGLMQTKLPVESVLDGQHSSSSAAPATPSASSAAPAKPRPSSTSPAGPDEVVLYVPEPLRGHELSPVWHFFRRKDPDTDYWNAWCQIAGCGRPLIRSATGTTNLYKHLERHHNLHKEDIQKQFDGVCDCGNCPEDGAPHGLEGNRRDEIRAARQKARVSQAKASAEVAQTTKLLPKGQRKILLWLPPNAQQRLMQSWTRHIVVGDLRPYRFCETANFGLFMQQLAAECGGTHQWKPPSHTSMSRQIKQDKETMFAAISALLHQVPDGCSVVHWDNWTDGFKRVRCIGWIFMLHPDTWAPLHLVFSFSQLAGWSDSEAGSSHSSNVAATALRSAWRTSKLPEHMPAYGCSDNTNPAVAVGSCLKIRTLRCLVHLIQLPMKRLLFDKEAKKANPLPRHLAAFEKLRTFCLYYKGKPDHQASFQRVKTCKDLDGDMPAVDSSSKWQATLHMVAGFSKSQELWQAAATRNEFGDHPPCLDEDEATLVLETLPVLECLHACTDLLQADSSLAAMYKPVVCAMRQDVGAMTGEFAKAFLQELDDAEQRHISTKLPLVLGDTAGHSSWESYSEFLDCAALCHPRYRQGLWLAEGERRERMQRLAQEFLRRFMNQHDIDDYLAPLPASLAIAPAPEKPKRKKAFTQAMSSLQSSLDSISGAGGTGPTEASVEAGDPNIHVPVINAQSLINRQSKAWHTSAAVRSAPDVFWRENREFWALQPGAFYMLSKNAGNAFGERVFSKSQRMLQDKRVGHAEIEDRILLNVNAPALQLPGYVWNAEARESPAHDE